ncbi:hypothetical protein K490DRAFT_46485 [Saccharata proteae CBS 121410]|uniref:Pre-mRNA-splicing factor RSE1 n=1 Tax=Saccharata proteae CBS 121410 TaxID=1314787 RepID=A0A9P4HPI3_9PEZI|nr:hypothetical protein K490DRAFT_46485 [Saccharata proteae CBS 121410]
MATTSSMFMYSLTVQPPSAVTTAVVGQFAGTKEQQILTACGSKLTLSRALREEERVKPLLTHDLFGIIRSLSLFRIAGSVKVTDLIIVGSDSGRIAILEYLPKENRLNRTHLETFGKSGVRRVIPGEYLACDPKGRACMIASVEKNKLVYTLNRNPQAEVTISSPLEAHQVHTIVYALTGLDVGWDNPVFASLEIFYGDSDQDPSGEAYQNIEKNLVYYELDLGLNHVLRKWSDAVDRTANMLFHVPGGNDGPSGVLVCSEESITYRHSTRDPLRVAIPRRKGATENPKRKRYIVAGVMHKLRGSAFFFLLQTEDGDLFKVTLDMPPDENGHAFEVTALNIKYFDTVPVAASLCILKSGFIFVAAESGPHLLYTFDSLGDDDDDAEFSSDQFPVDPTEAYDPVYFHPRPLKNLSLIHALSKMNPLMGCKVANLIDEDVPQIYTINGSGARSSLKTMKHGLEVLEIVESDLPSSPELVWTVKLHADHQWDSYIVLSFQNATLVLVIGETVEEFPDSGFLSSTKTLAVQLLGEDALLQVHPRGIRHIRPNGRINEWDVPQHRTIVAATTNEHQVAVALSSGEIIYFEMDAEGSLAEYEEKKAMSGTVTCLSMGEVPKGRQRSSFLAVGCDDSTVRILSLDPDSTLENKSVQALTSAPSDLSILAMEDSSSGGSTLYLHIGLYSGVYLRTVLDEITGELSDTRLRFLGTKAVLLARVPLHGQTAILAVSSRSWLAYSDKQTKNFTLTPLAYGTLNYGWSFNSPQCIEGVVGIYSNKLRIFAIESIDRKFLQESIPLAYTPRDFVRHPSEALFYVIEADNNTLSSTSRNRLLNDSNVVNGDGVVLPPEEFGYPRANGHWASAIQVVDPVSQMEVVHTIELEDNENAVSVAVVSFESQNGESFLVVGTGQNMVMAPLTYACGFIHTYRFTDNGRGLDLIHKTKTDAPPLALMAFQGKLLAGIGTTLRLYDVGMKQLLRKAQAHNIVPNMLTGLQTQGHRIIASDARESVTYVVYTREENRLIPFCDDSISRWTTCTTMVDYETTCGGDKFGNLWLLRCPQTASADADEEGSGAHLIHEKGYLQGAPHRLELMAHFFTNDIPTSVHKTSLTAGGKDLVLWSGLSGSLGILVPFESREDVDFFQSLEQQMRTEDPPIAGRDHLMYRGYYVPVKGCIDGDLCERYLVLPRDKKEMIAAELDRTVREVERKIDDARTRVAY